MDRLGWTVGRTFEAYGLRVGMRSNAPEALEQAVARVPPGWQPVPNGEVDFLYSLWWAPPSKRRGQRNYHLLYCGAALLARTLEPAVLYEVLAHHAEQLTAIWARDGLFVHAGVVGWQGGAILLPGRSMSGKTVLVKALVEAGATYYSDEFAVLDREGRVHPYPRPLCLRGEDGQEQQVSANALGAPVGREPLPVRLIAFTHYRPGAAWRPRRLTPGQALLGLMEHTVAARGNPAHSMPILKQAVMQATAIKTARGEAEAVVPRLLAWAKRARPER